MTDLLTRIRAYVAAIPTHYCFECSEDVVSVDGGCPNCGKDWIPEKLTESPADALLREVAALQPKAFLVHDGRAFLDAAYTDEGYAMKQLAHRRDDATLSPLYTLTGATHAPE